MRLIKRSSDGNLELISFSDDDTTPPYAILSHTWTAGQEVTYDELIEGRGRDKTGYTKIQFCVDRAVKDGIDYTWVDTCCINKSTSDELSTAINSMFRWYQHSARCYVYLSDVHVPAEVTNAQDFRITWDNAFRRSRWFTRGWTLQELLAPPIVEFFSKEGKLLGSRISLEQAIHEVTRIPVSALRGQSLSEFSIDERMSWAASRKTTVKEDKAYCLLGIFGIFMSLIYGEGEEHAYRRLRRELLESLKGKQTGDNNQILSLHDQSTTQLKPSSNVPFPRDNDFVDRGDLLARIDQRCSLPAGRAALVGFGGFGKSQLAIEYTYRVRQKSPDVWVFWVYASNSARVEASFSDIAEKAGLSLQPNATIDTLQLVRRWLCNKANGKWLIIIDNLDTEIIIEMQKDKQKISLASLLPQTDHGAILITSRNADVARSLVREKDIITIGTMSGNEATQLLENYLGNKSTDNAIQLANTLDCIPLAIVQAAAYINRLYPRMTVTKYLEELKSVEKQAQLLYRTTVDFRRDEQASNSVLITWQVSFNYIRQKRPWAIHLLSFMSFFNRQRIPQFMICHYTDNDCRQGEEADFEEDMAVLRAFSLVSIMEHKDEFEMHSLVQFATRIWLRSTNEQEKWLQRFIQVMAQEFPNGEYDNWAKCQTLFSHVFAIIEEERSSRRNTNEWARLLHNAGWYAWRQGHFKQAEGMVLQALEIRKEVSNADANDTLSSSSLLGSIYLDLGKLKEAESINRQTLACKEKVLGPEHPNTLVSMSNLAQVLDRQEKYNEAEAINRQTLA